MDKEGNYIVFIRFNKEKTAKRALEQVSNELGFIGHVKQVGDDF